MRTILIFLLPLVLVAAACEMQQEIEVDLPPQAPVTFIECYLEEGLPARALATQSVAFFDSAEVVPANDLEISLSQGNRQIQLTNAYSIDSFYNNAYNYISPDTIQYEENSVWEIVVRRQGQELARGVSRFLPKPRVKNINYSLQSQDSLLSVQVQIEDNPAQENYYRLTIHNIDFDPSSGFMGIWSDQTASGNLIQMNTGFKLKAVKNVMVVTVYQIDKAYYTFLESLQKAAEANYNPFAQPSNVISNLQGDAQGVFTAVSGSSHHLQLKR